MTALLMGFIIGPFLLGQLIGPVLKHFMPSSQEQTLTLLSFIAPLFCWILILWQWRIRYGAHTLLTGIGLIPAKPWTLYTTYTVLCLLLLLTTGTLLGTLAEWFQWPFEKPELFFPPTQLPIITAFAITTAPILEEISFRGLLQPTIIAKFGSALKGVIFSAVLFTMFHSLYYNNWIALSYVFLLGLILGWVRHRSGSLIPCILGHFLNNVLASLMIWYPGW